MIDKIKPSDIKYFQEIILNWYSKNGRDFVWRKKTITNYEIIIAEIFLQRTKAETVNKFLPSFYEKYPNWKQLGEVTEIDLQTTLRPLGLYNQRGTRLYKLAQEIKKRNGIFPRSREVVEELPMMGQYITNAFELYILNKPAPLLDVNMARVLERFFGPRQLADIRHDPFLQGLANSVVNHAESRIINWAVLDFAALICRTRDPKCITCLLGTECIYLNIT